MSQKYIVNKDLNNMFDVSSDHQLKKGCIINQTDPNENMGYAKSVSLAMSSGFYQLNPFEIDLVHILIEHKSDFLSPC